MIIAKRGDTHYIEFVVNADLAAATVRGFLLGPDDAATPTLFALELSVVDAAGGKLRHKLTGNLVPGDYDFEVEIQRAGETVTAPTEGYFRIRILADLDRGLVP